MRVGDHAWYTYGASADHDRRLKPSNALQWRMLRDAHASGATVYDLRGIGASLDADDPLFGLTRFKLGSGGRAVEYLGEWELPLNRLLHRAVGAYLARRGRRPRCRSRCTSTPTAGAPPGRVSARYPGIVPVIKGNGYGVGLSRLAARPGGWAPTRSPSVPSTRCPCVAARVQRGGILVLQPHHPALPSRRCRRGDAGGSPGSSPPSRPRAKVAGAAA